MRDSCYVIRDWVGQLLQGHHVPRYHASRFTYHAAPMSQLDPNRRFQIAYDRARADWAAADPARCAALAGCVRVPEGVIVPYFGRPHLVTHPDGEAIVQATGKPART